MTAPDDDLRARLHSAAETIESGDLSLDDVRGTVRRRRLLTRVGTVVGVVGLVAAGVVAVVATGDSDDPGTLVSVDPTVPESPETTVRIDDTATTLPEPATPGVTVQVVERPGVTGQVVGVGGAPQYGEWSTPWRDGFIVGAQVYAPQPLPAELPEEIAALFPPEVRELFGGELPPTIDEAMAMLSEAGLLDVVADIIAANPEASEAIYSVPVDEDGPTLDVRFTTDGVAWEPIEMALPPGASYLHGVTTVGDRVAVAYAMTDPTTGMNLDGIVRVATTTDLVNWDVQELVAPPPSVTFPTGIDWSTDVVGFAANESGWALSVHGGANVDFEVLLPADGQPDFADGTDYGISNDESGISIERRVGDTVETVRYTWDELGVDPDVAAYVGGRGAEPTLWASTWGGTPTPAGVDEGFGQVVATSAGFLRIGQNVRFSPDGITWTPVELPVDDAFVSGSIVFDGGLVLLVSDFDGDTRFVRVDETGGSPALLDVPGLPANVQSGYSQSSSEALMFDASEPPPPPPPLVVEFEGYRLTLDHVDSSIEVVDVATGDVVVESNLRNLGSEDEGNVAFGLDGVTITDPTTGDVIVAIPNDVLEAANNTTSPDTEFEYVPDFWLLGSRDGERFLLVDLEDATGPNSPMVGALASNGSIVLVQVDDEWLTYELP